MLKSSRRSRYRFIASVATPLVAVASLPGVASAKSEPQATDAKTVATGEADILVTARRREETLKDIPLAITAISGASLKAAQVQSLRDIANLTPGLIVTDGGGQFYTTPTIRGQAQLNTQNGAAENNVSVFLNGVYLSNPGAINLGLINMDRVEVVKGPVSSLYGRSAFAGAINYVTQTPSSRPTLSFDVTGGNYRRAGVDATVSGPLGEHVRATIGGLYDYFTGTWKDPINGNRAGGYRKRDAFGSLYFDLGPGTVLTLDGYYGNDHFDQPAQYHLTNNCAFSGGVAQQYCGKIAQGSVIASPPAADSGAAGNDRTVTHIDATLKQKLGGGYTATVIGGYNREHARQFLEINNRDEGLPYALVPGPGVAFVNEYYGDDNTSKDYSGEIRIASPQYDHLRFSTGGFYYHSDGEQFSNLGVNQDQIPQGQSINSFLANLWLTPGGQPSPIRNHAETSGDQYSAFVEGEYKFTNTLSFAQEGRYTAERKHIQVLSSAVAPGATFAPHAKTFRYANTRSTLRYTPNADLMLYASVANGTKSGGFNGRATDPRDLAYAPEKNWTYEAGVKGALLDERVSYQFAVYHIDATNLQILGPNHDPANPGQVVANYGGSRNTGFEIETQARISSVLRLNLGFSYTDPKFTSGSYDAQYAGICALLPSCAVNLTTLNGQSVINLRGKSLPRQSKFQGIAGLNLEAPLSEKTRHRGQSLT